MTATPPSAALPPKAQQALRILVHILADQNRPRAERIAAGDAIETAMSWIADDIPVAHQPLPGTTREARDLLLAAAAEDTRPAAIVCYGLAARLLLDVPT